MESQRKSEIKYDERLVINRLRAADIAFRFFFLVLSLLLLLHATSIINEGTFVAIIGPLAAGGVLCSYISYYWFEKNG